MGGWGRLIEAGWRLARNDALLPRELEDFYPPQILAASRSLRMLHGDEARRGRPGERLARTLEGLGPVAIKLGQLLSTRADVFGAEFALDLARLKDRLAPFAHDVARAEVERSLGQPVETLFAYPYGRLTNLAALPSTKLTGQGPLLRRRWRIGK